MGDITGLPALDVLIGMAFLFFLMATVVASINEVIQTVLNARARTLTRGIKTLLGDKAAANTFYEQWRVARLAKPAGLIRNVAKHLPLVAESRRPSYIPARTFALTLLETAAPEEGTRLGANLIEEAQKTVETFPAALRDVASTGLSNAERELEAIRKELEKAFDEAMDRASGWYKRYVQWWLIVLSLIVTIGLNVSAFTVGERLWKDDALRAAVVQQAQAAVDEEDSETDDPKTPATVAAEIDKIDELKLPIGWDDANTKGDDLSRVVGWLITAAAISLGAPFWFDVLGKLASLRGTGNREGTAKNDRAPEDRDDPSGKR
jgi:hypothetical protein